MDKFEKAWLTYGTEASNLEQQYRPAFCKIVRKWTFNETDFEDMYSDVVIWRLPRFIETWDPTTGVSIMAYIMGVMNWWCLKWIQKRKRRAGYYTTDRYTEIEDNDSHLSGNVVEVKDILDQLSEYDAYLLNYHYIEGFTYAEIAEACDISRSKARTHCIEALEKAKCIALKSL